MEHTEHKTSKYIGATNHTEDRMEQREGFSQTAPNFEGTNQTALHQLLYLPTYGSRNKINPHRKILNCVTSQTPNSLGVCTVGSCGGKVHQ